MSLMSISQNPLIMKVFHQSDGLYVYGHISTPFLWVTKSKPSFKSSRSILKRLTRSLPFNKFNSTCDRNETPMEANSFKPMNIQHWTRPNITAKKYARYMVSLRSRNWSSNLWRLKLNRIRFFLLFKWFFLYTLYRFLWFCSWVVCSKTRTYE